MQHVDSDKRKAFNAEFVLILLTHTKLSVSC